MKNKSELSSAQKWERATLADNFIFCKVMFGRMGETGAREDKNS